jgi:hypothetical protein
MNQIQSYEKPSHDDPPPCTMSEEEEEWINVDTLSPTETAAATAAAAAADAKLGPVMNVFSKAEDFLQDTKKFFDTCMSDFLTKSEEKENPTEEEEETLILSMVGTNIFRVFPMGKTLKVLPCDDLQEECKEIELTNLENVEEEEEEEKEEEEKVEDLSKTIYLNKGHPSAILEVVKVDKEENMLGLSTIFEDDEVDLSKTTYFKYR